MNRLEILDRLEAILEDTVGRKLPPTLREELECFFNEEDLEKFKGEVATEFEVESDIVFAEVLDFKDLLEALGAFSNSEKCR
jgi:hypothetical protein